MKIKIFALSITLSSFFLYPSESPQSRNVTWQSKNSNVLWLLQDTAFRAILTTQAEEKKSREQIKIKHDIALLSIKFQETLKRVESLEHTMYELSETLTSIENIIAKKMGFKKL